MINKKATLSWSTQKKTSITILQYPTKTCHYEKLTKGNKKEEKSFKPNK